MDTQIHQTTATAVRPFRVDLLDEVFTDAAQDIQLAIMKEFARYCGTELLDHDTRSYMKMLQAFSDTPKAS